MRTIKRYGNRKLYDTSLRRYINLVEISDLVQKGVEVRVMDSKTGEDITKITLSQILLDKEKKKEGFVSKTLFTDLIRKGSSSVVSYLKRSAKSGMGVLGWAEDEINAGIKRLTHAGEITEQQARKLREDLISRMSKGKADVERRVEQSVEVVLHRLNIPAQKDIKRLSDKLAQLSAQVEKLAGKKAVKPAAAPKAAGKSPVRKSKGTSGKENKAEAAGVQVIAISEPGSDSSPRQ